MIPPRKTASRVPLVLPVMVAIAWLAFWTGAIQAQGPSEEKPAAKKVETVTPASTAAVDAAPAKSRYRALMVGLTIFLLALFVGFEVIAKVPPTLHTPLMSGSNAISGITVVGSIVAAGSAVTAGSGETDLWRWLASVTGLVAVALAMINVVGGFWVTHRMLGMFRGKSE